MVFSTVTVGKKLLHFPGRGALNSEFASVLIPVVLVSIP